MGMKIPTSSQYGHIPFGESENSFEDEPNMGFPYGRYTKRLPMTKPTNEEVTEELLDKLENVEHTFEDGEYKRKSQPSPKPKPELTSEDSSPSIPEHRKKFRENVKRSIENEGYFSRNEFLEIARSVYDHDNTTYGDEMTKFLYCVLTYLGAEGPMAGIEQNSIFFAEAGDDLIGNHGILAYVDGSRLSKKRAAELEFLEPDYFQGLVGIKLPKLLSQAPEVYAVSGKIEEYGSSPEVHQRLETKLRNDSFNMAEVGLGVRLVMRSHLNDDNPLKNIVYCMHNVQQAHDFVVKGKQ